MRSSRHKAKHWLAIIFAAVPMLVATGTLPGSWIDSVISSIGVQTKTGCCGSGVCLCELSGRICLCSAHEDGETDIDPSVASAGCSQPVDMLVAIGMPGIRDTEPTTASLPEAWSRRATPTSHRVRSLGLTTPTPPPRAA